MSRSRAPFWLLYGVCVLLFAAASDLLLGRFAPATEADVHWNEAGHAFGADRMEAAVLGSAP